jgi:hypothetical protein
MMLPTLTQSFRQSMATTIAPFLVSSPHPGLQTITVIQLASWNIMTLEISSA